MPPKGEAFASLTQLNVPVKPGSRARGLTGTGGFAPRGPPKSQALASLTTTHISSEPGSQARGSDDATGSSPTA
ncbi:hypothetical protein BN13_740007 [Nostocoides jenkinsii Ben 74]|uniref:Uncharacterized protein n=1 Tax=Nostocoides jenkinsii Ben 74 TaxID=1193518 RepID=A0A077MEQ4_9MICO|nr:hypothetical protein BN13_740007 [Tetrasphaera jenkinsii Ben 74]